MSELVQDAFSWVETPWSGYGSGSQKVKVRDNYFFFYNNSGMKVLIFLFSQEGAKLYCSIFFIYDSNPKSKLSMALGSL